MERFLRILLLCLHYLTLVILFILPLNIAFKQDLEELLYVHHGKFIRITEILALAFLRYWTHFFCDIVNHIQNLLYQFFYYLQMKLKSEFTPGSLTLESIYPNLFYIHEYRNTLRWIIKHKSSWQNSIIFRSLFIQTAYVLLTYMYFYVCIKVYMIIYFISLKLLHKFWNSVEVLNFVLKFNRLESHFYLFIFTCINFCKKECVQITFYTNESLCSSYKQLVL